MDAGGTACDTADCTRERARPLDGDHPTVPPSDLGVVRYPSPARELPREVVLQEWEGQVQEVGERVFSARLVDLTQDSKEETEETDLPIEDLGEADRGLVIPGAIFR